MRVKFLFVAVVTTLFLTVSSNVIAQDYVRISSVEYVPYNNAVVVSVCFTNLAKEKCKSVNFKVVCTDGLFAGLLNDRAKYSKVSSDEICTSVSFGCGEGETKEKAKQCRLYDFKVETTDYELKK